MILFLFTGALFLFYALLLTWLSGGFRRLRPSLIRHYPSLSIIVPAHNEARHLPVLLSCLERQIYPSDRLEIILVNDRSNDGTEKIMKNFVNHHARSFMISIKDVDEEFSPKKYAITRGIESATGEIVLTTDADAIPGPRWAEAMAGCFAPDTDMVIGYAPYRTDGPYDSFFHRLLALEYFVLGCIGAASLGRGYPISANGANLAYKRKRFISTGGFGPGRCMISGDDDLLLHRFRYERGFHVRYALSRDARVFNNPPSTLLRFIKQRLRFSSKHLRYPPRLLAAMSLTYAFYSGILLLIAGSILMPSLRCGTAILLSGKIAVELFFLSRGKPYLEQRNLIRYYPFAFFPHLLYVVLIPFFARFLRTRW